MAISTKQFATLSNRVFASSMKITKLLMNIMKTFTVHRHIAKAIHVRKRFNRFLHILGPGLVTGAADDDPSGIATYSQAGAVAGYKLLWSIPFIFPLLLAVQESCARIGAVTGKGLATLLREHYSNKVLFALVTLVVVANSINIGADLGAMAAALGLLLPSIPFMIAAVGFSVAILLMELFVPYKRYATILKWLALMLFAYPITAFVVGQPWDEVLRATLTPHIDFTPEMMFLLVGILGTTISPYLFFWDTSEVAEDEIAKHRLGLKGLHPPKITRHFIRSVRIDTFAGMFLASITAWFIMLTCATVLYSSGITEINTAADAAKAIEPLVSSFPNAGLVAKLIFSVGIIGLGLLAVPVLAGSSSYAISEAFGWREGLGRTLKRAPGFYAVIVLATLVGLSINFLGIDPMKALLFAAVFNGIAAVPLLLMIARIGARQDIMGEYKNNFFSHIGVLLAFGIMALAAVALFVSFT